LKKRILIIVLILCFFIAAYFSLSYSGRVNNFVFSNIVNPYDPLEVKTSQPIKKDSLVDGYWEDPRGLFPIFAYNVPDVTNDLTASLKIIEKGGINIIVNGNLGWMPYPYKVKEAFDRLGKSKLKWLAIIENECKDSFVYNNANNETNFDVKNYLYSFNQNYIYGWKVWDEPGRNRKLCTPFNLVPNDDNADINRLVKQIRSDPALNTKLDFINLYPTYWDGTPDKEAYEKYVDVFFTSQEYKPRVLCFDHYPFLKPESGGFRNDYYLNLEIIRNKSLQYNVPFWMIVLSSGHWGYKDPTFEEISFQVYSALAYGAKGIGYYMYSKSWERVGYTSWILEDNVDNPNVADSLHGPLFVPVQKLNENIQTLGKILINLKTVEVIHTSDYPNNQKEIVQSIFKSNQSNGMIKQITNTAEPNTDPKLLIGVFEEMNSTSSEGKYLLIVNKDASSSSKIIVSLDMMHSIFKFDKKTGEKKFINTNEDISQTISAGCGELFYVE
jgi:hypothetical protein